MWVCQVLRDSNYGQDLCSQDLPLCFLPDENNSTNFTHTLTQNSSIENNQYLEIYDKTRMNESQINNNSSQPIVDDYFNVINQTCIDCENHVMYFGLVVVIVDWSLFVLGSLYLCSFCCRRVRVLKDQLLVITRET